MQGDDEAAERQRQARERAQLPVVDRLHGSEPRKTASGFRDLRSNRRTGRVVQMPLRLHPRVKAIIDAIMLRDRHPSMVALFEEMVETYQQVHGPIDLTALPSDDDFVRQIEQERDKRDAE